jgi:hypothetical protein
MASLNHNFVLSEREIFLRNGLDTRFRKSAGVLPVVSRRQHFPTQCFGTVPPARLAEILSDRRVDAARAAPFDDDRQADRVQSALPHLVKTIRSNAQDYFNNH